MRQTDKPTETRRRLLGTGVWTLCMISVAGCSDLLDRRDGQTPTPSPTPEPIPEFEASHSEQYSDVQTIERETHETLNERRIEHGLDPVGYDQDLADIARVHSRDMADRGFFAHENPDGEGHSDRLDRFGYSSNNSGEIIAEYAATPRDSADQRAINWAVDSWMESEGHREQILGERYVVSGVGVYITAEPVVYWTVLFSGQNAEIPNSGD